jgi:hypothetical protein
LILTLHHLCKFNLFSHSKLFLVLNLLLLLVTSCSKPNVQDYADQHPIFNFKVFFTGIVEAWGIVQDFNGKVINSFTLQINGEWQNNSGLIKESFTWKDGSTTQRTWHLEQVADHQFQGYANESNGIAIGQEAGNAMHWEYDSIIPSNGESATFHFDDWSYVIANDVLINKAKIQKFGLTVGEITIVMKKPKTFSSNDLPPL